jgi:hypothetical protein
MLNMRKFILSLTLLIPFFVSAQTPPPPTGEDFGGPVAPGYPIDNTIFVLLLSLLVCVSVFIYLKKFNYYK